METILINELEGAGGAIGEIVLNAPQKLNAIDCSMFSIIHHHLLMWQNNDHIKAVLVRSNCENAFCAGGDIRAIYDCRANYQKQVDFFRLEYQTNSIIAHYPKPYISLLDGITMGGGAGISIHGSHRIATEHLKFAMPETAIGFFPDVGMSHPLQRCPGEFGTYLALTGNQIRTGDAFLCGLVTHTVKQKHINDIIQCIINTPFTANDKSALDQALQSFHHEYESEALLPQQTHINHHFAKNNVSDILKSLQMGDEWCQSTCQTLEKRSPLSLSIALQKQRQARALDFDVIIQTDFDLVHHFLRGRDFYEGIRAALIDKDKNPCWQPSHIAGVTTPMVDAYFEYTQALF